MELTIQLQEWPAPIPVPFGDALIARQRRVPQFVFLLAGILLLLLLIYYFTHNNRYEKQHKPSRSLAF